MKNKFFTLCFVSAVLSNFAATAQAAPISCSFVNQLESQAAETKARIQDVQDQKIDRESACQLLRKNTSYFEASSNYLEKILSSTFIELRNCRYKQVWDHRYQRTTWVAQCDHVLKPSRRVLGEQLSGLAGGARRMFFALDDICQGTRHAFTSQRVESALDSAREIQEHGEQVELLVCRR